MTKEKPAVEVIYGSRTAPTFLIGGCQFENSSFATKDAAIIEMLDTLIATKPSISQQIYKIDRAAALALAEKHKQAQVNAAVKGSMSSSDLKMQSEINRSQEFAKVQADPATAEVISEQDLLVTEPVDFAEPKAAVKMLGKKGK